MELYLETERLILRPFNIKDVDKMYDNWASDEEVTKYLTWNAHKSKEITEMILKKWIEEYQKPERINFGIVLKENNELIGGIDIVGYLEDKTLPVIGYVLSRKYWSKGYMTEACRCVLEYLFSHGYKKVRIDAQKENIGSNKVIQKVGGRYIGTINDFFELKGDYRDINQYEVDIYPKIVLRNNIDKVHICKLFKRSINKKTSLEEIIKIINDDESLFTKKGKLICIINSSIRIYINSYNYSIINIKNIKD